MNVNKYNENYGFSYKISDPVTCETKGFLQGTCHFFNFSYELNTKIRNIFKQSKCLVVESDLSNYSTYFKSLWRTYASSDMNIYYLQSGIFDYKPGVDHKLLGLANNIKMPVIELETVDEHMSYLEINAHRYLNSKDRDDEKLRSKLNSMFIAYMSGSKLAIKDFGFHAERPQEEIDDLYARNVKMAQKIHSLLVQNSCPLVAVGAMHLYSKRKNEDGLINLLRKRGWKVTRILDRRDFNDLNLTNHLNKKNLEKWIVQDCCASFDIEQMLANQAVVTAKTIIKASYTKIGIKNLPLLIQHLKLSDDPDFSLLTILEGISSSEEQLNALLEEKTKVSFSCVSASLERQFSEKFILKLLKQCKDVHMSSTDMIHALRGNYSDEFIIELLDHCQAGVIGNPHISLLEDRNFLNQSLNQFASRLKSNPTIDFVQRNDLDEMLPNCKNCKKDLIPLFEQKM